MLARNGCLLQLETPLKTGSTLWTFCKREKAVHTARLSLNFEALLDQRGDVLQAQLVGLTQHPIHKEAKDAEDRVEAHVGGHGPCDL